MRLLARIVALVALLLSFILCDGQPFQVYLQSNWASPPLEFELLETLVEFNSSSYFHIINQLSLTELNSDAEIYDNFIKLLKKEGVMEDKDWNLFDMFLASRYASPKVIAHFQFFNETVLTEVNKQGECDNWIQVGNKAFCDVNEVVKLLEDKKINVEKVNEEYISSQKQPFDHTHPSFQINQKELLNVIFYTPKLDTKFQKNHQVLSQLAEKGNIQYILRYAPLYSNKNVYLSGYGAHLNIKNIEYKTVDDRVLYNDEEFENEIDSIDSEYNSHNNLLINKLISEPTIINELKDENYTDLSYKTSKYILDSKLPLSTWTYLTQNFPKHSSFLASKKLGNNICSGIQFQRDWFRTAPAPNILFVNGIPISLTEVDIFHLLNVLNIERKTVNSLLDLGMELNSAVDFLNNQLLESKDKNQDDSSIFDVREDINNSFIIWLNDLQKDDLYKDWDKSIKGLLNGMYGGYLPEVAVNYANVLFALDLSNPEVIDTFNAEILPLINGGVPIRFGFIPLISDDVTSASNILASFFIKISKLYDSKKVILMMEQLHNLVTKEESIIDTLKRLIKQEKLNLKWEDLSNDLDIKITINKYMKRLNLKLKDPIFFVNGERLNYDANYQRSLVTSINKQLNDIREMIRNEELRDDMNIYDHLLSLPGVYKSYSNLIFNSDTSTSLDSSYTTFIPELHHHQDILTNFNYFTNIKSNNIEQDSIPITIILLDDLNTNNGILLTKKLLKFMEKNNNLRISIIHQSTNEFTNGLSSLVYESLNSENLDLNENSELLKDIESKDFGIKIDMREEEMLYWQKMQLNLNHINLNFNSPAIIVNGKIFILENEEDYELIDIDMLINYEKKKRLNDLLNSIKQAELFLNIEDKMKLADLFMKLSGILGKNLENHQNIARFENKPGQRQQLPSFSAEECRFQTGDKEQSWANLKFILNPISIQGQKWAPILEVLSKINGVYLDGYLNPIDDSDDLKRLNSNFFRFNFNSKLNFDKNGDIIPSNVKFTKLPKDTLLTAGIDAISSWVVMPSQSIYDLDNLQLKESNSGIEAIFTLKHILIEGHAQDLNTQSSPRGLQFLLNTAKNETNVDTLVMANLGYFQLKANPGVYFINLRHGKSDMLYELQTLGSRNNKRKYIHNQLGHRLILNGFGGTVLFPKVYKKSGMEHLSLLDEEESDTKVSLWDKFFGKNEVKVEEPTIHVFTVASGHLYERFLSVMMLSVLKNTKSNVKFWFIENFLSPNFKHFIPKMAEKYKFDYELITYQWPHWLNQQSEKQRKLWGYKILFLDVLFPLSVDKVIFVDADQMVRADLKELIDHDLEGAPYGYVPFCKSRESMKGYRFWEQGYWKDHLQGKPYHISALYVVDLKRFRSLAAGDQLRGHYQMLSYDPNSLANLDQDLPNHLQLKLKIHSLPMEWLWCETWCDDESLKKAKTIDLCNNPETKEPKLDRAKRILPEWQSLDDEIKGLRDFEYQVEKEEVDGDKKEAKKESKNSKEKFKKDKIESKKDQSSQDEKDEL
ncbi:hypothetical protein K502DRAFT_348257 [Neoconidiobolus thromboides FSU 785]|nr:hypothetical protein K502DRAFT_348257 [Neoconidiobolus thromboides FSU 785]